MAPRGYGFWQRQDRIRTLKTLRPGKSAKELAKLFDTTVSSVFSAFYRAGIVVQPKRKRCTDSPK